MPSTPSDPTPTDLGSLDLHALKQQNDAATAAIKDYELDFVLNTQNIVDLDISQHPLNWSSIKFGKADIQMVPNDSRGIYAFVISNLRPFLPPHGYIVYIGIAGRDSDRSLRARYRDYFKQSYVQIRAPIRRMIERWHLLLRFHFAPVAENVTSTELKQLEKRLNTAFLPPFNKGDIEADTKKHIAAFK